MANQNMTAWFNGPKAENGDVLEDAIQRIVQDYNYWRRNYYPEDGVTMDSQQRRENEPFHDAFQDRLIELLALLKADFPFQSPRYAAHMVAEETLPSIAGYFAAMLYNPNNVTGEAAPVTVRLETEASQMIAKMVGYTPESWAHLTSGGTVANLEAMWVARSTKYLPLVVADMRSSLGLDPEGVNPVPMRQIGLNPVLALKSMERCFADAEKAFGNTVETTSRAIRAYRDSEWNVVERGMRPVCNRLNSDPVVLVPESAHYCFPKALDVLGLGRRSLVKVGVDPDFRMRVDELEETLERVEKEGKHVIAVVAVVGTTEEGAVDPVDQIVNLRKGREAAGKSSFWIHVDAAYGGYLRTVTIPNRLGLGEPSAEVNIRGTIKQIPLNLPEHSACEALEQLGECDSVTIDPHKLGYIPYPAGAVCFKTNRVRPVLRQDAPYIEEAPGSATAERKAEGIGMYILEGSKPGAAAASVWLSHSLIPLDNTGHGILIRNSIRNACELSSLLERYPDLCGAQAMQAECLCSPGSNIVCFAFRPAEGTIGLAGLNALNRRIYERFNVSATSGRRVYDQPFFLSRTTLTHAQYGLAAVTPFLRRLGVREDEYEDEGVFLLRSVLMNPWYAESKRRGRHFLSEMVDSLYREAAESLP